MELSNYIPHKPKSRKFIAVTVTELEIPEFRARTVFFVMFTLCVCACVCVCTRVRMHGLHRWLGGKASACQCRSARDMGLISGWGRSRGGNGNLLQDSCLENSMNRRAWQARAAKSWTQLSIHTHTFN